jgi:hypothetical protein
MNVHKNTGLTPRGRFGSESIDTAVKGWQACETDSQHLMNDNARPKVHFSTVTTILEPSDCTLMLPGFMLRLVAVSHHPVGDLLPRSIRNPFSSSRFCAAHMSGASVANSTSSSFTRSSKLAAICVRPFSVNAGRYSSFRRQSVSTGISNRGAMITSTATKLGG